MAESTVEQTVRLAPFQEQFLADIFASAKDLTDPESGTMMPFAKQQLAGLSQGQQLAIAKALQQTTGGGRFISPVEPVPFRPDADPRPTMGGGVGAFEPFLQQGAQAVGQGIEAVGTGLGTIGSAIGQTAQAGFDPTAYQQFMNPFTEDVIQKQYQDIADQGMIQRAQLGAGAAGAGAFGGSRQGIAEAEIAANVLDQQARTGAQLRSAGFQQAQNLAQQQANQALRQAQLTGQLGQTTGALGGQIGQLGVQTAGLGQLGQQMGVQDINTLLGIGGLQQQQGQKEFDVQRANQLAQQALPFQRIGFMSDIFRGVPALQQTYSTTTTPPPSRTSQLLGLGIAGLGAAGQAGSFGKLLGMA